MGAELEGPYPRSKRRRFQYAFHNIGEKIILEVGLSGKSLMRFAVADYDEAGAITRYLES